jgi:hypothetical protein
MQQVIKRLLWIGGLAFGLQSAWGFALLGPVAEAPGPGGSGAARGDSWELPEITYNPLTAWDTLPVGPKNLGEEYRRNSPVLYYACDASFLGYFGSNGMAAVDQAFDIMNSLTNVSSYSSSLSEFPLNSQSINYRAQGLGLLDVKSETLHLLLEQMGLINPVRYVWTLHSRYIIPGGSCTAGDVEYLVVQRNFDIIPSPLNQIQYSSYVNNTLYSYIIAEYCDARFSPFGPQAVLADAVEFPVDPLADVFTPVAAGDGGWLIENPAVPPFRPPILLANAMFPFGFGLVVGGFYNGLTRDDVAGLRYLLRTNNINWENPTAGSILTGSTTIGVTNLSPPSLLFTSNYNAFWSSAQTNAPATLSNLFPGLVILTSPYYFTNIATPNIIAYYTNSFVFGNPPVLVVKTNGFTSSYLAIYSDTFANLVLIPNGHYPNTSAQLVTVTVSPGFVLGNPLVTNTTSKAVTLANVPSGEYYINTNYLCGPPVFLSTLGTNVTATTNFLFATSNSAGYFTSQSLVIYSTTHVYVVEQRICSTTVTGGPTNSAGLYQGIEGVKFIKTTYDSLVGQFYQPITNIYTMVDVSGGQAQKQTFLRVVTTPDILFRAEDMSGPLPFFTAINRNVNFDDTQRLPGLAGPGTINPASTIIYNKVGDVFLQGTLGTTNAFLSEASQVSMLAWGSFDGTTNDPVVYPNGTSIENLENQILSNTGP